MTEPVASAANELHTHIAIILAVVVPVASAAASWGVVKTLIKSLQKDSGETKGDIIEIRRELKEKADKDSVTSVRMEIADIQKDMFLKVPFNVCSGERDKCHADRISLAGDVSKQISCLVAEIKSQDEKRQETNDKNHEMFRGNSEQIICTRNNHQGTVKPVPATGARGFFEMKGGWSKYNLLRSIRYMHNSKPEYVKGHVFRVLRLSEQIRGNMAQLGMI